MPKHCAYVSVRLIFDTDTRLSAEVVEELLHSMDYSFESDYGSVATQIVEQEIMWTNKDV
jgi:hypothetical protein